MLAYWRTSFSGFVPCRVLSDRPYSKPGQDGLFVKLRTTAARGPYPKGHIVETRLSNVVRRPLRISRQSKGRLYGFTLGPEDFQASRTAAAAHAAGLFFASGLGALGSAKAGRLEC